MDTTSKLCQLMEEGNGYVVIKITHRISKYIKWESGTDGAGLGCKNVRPRDEGDALQRVLKGKDVSGWSVVEVNYQNVQTKKRKDIQKIVKQSVAGNQCCVIKIVRGINPPMEMPKNAIDVAEPQIIAMESKSISSTVSTISNAEPPDEPMDSVVCATCS